MSRPDLATIRQACRERWATHEAVLSVQVLCDYVETLERVLQGCAFPGEDVCTSGALWLGGQQVIEVREALGLNISSGEAPDGA